MLFELFFFKGKNVVLNANDIITFFYNKDCFELNYENISEELVINYNNEALRSDIKLLISKKIIVPNMFKLSPEYKNLNFVLKIPLDISSYLAYDIFKMVEKLALMFNLSVYNKAFDDISLYNVERLSKLFRLYQETIYKNFDDAFENNFFLEERTLFNLCNYETFRISKKSNYDSMRINRIDLYCNEYSSELEIHSKIGDDINVIIYSGTTHISINKDSKIYLLDFDRIKPFIRKITKVVPGCDSGIYINEKAIKIIKKSIKKFVSINKNDVRYEVEINQLIEKIG